MTRLIRMPKHSSVTKRVRVLSSRLASLPLSLSPPISDNGIPRLESHPSPGMGVMRALAVYISYALPPPRHNPLSQPPIWPLSRGQMGELHLLDDSSVHRFAGAVLAVACIAGLRGGS